MSRKPNEDEGLDWDAPVIVYWNGEFLGKAPSHRTANAWLEALTGKKDLLRPPPKSEPKDIEPFEVLSVILNDKLR